jgi:hypothetical protein
MGLARKIEATVAVGLALAVAGCAPKADEALNEGCDVHETAAKIGERVLDGGDIKIAVYTDADGNTANFVIRNGRNEIYNPLVLLCGDKLLGYAGVKDPLKERRDPNYDPVRIISSGDPDTTLYSLSRDQQGNFIPPSDIDVKTVHLGHVDPSAPLRADSQYAIGFTDNEDVFGAMPPSGYKGGTPSVPHETQPAQSQPLS